MVIVGVVAILLFGSKLPDVMRSFGKSYREFRGGLSEFHSHINLSDSLTSAPTKSYSSNFPGTFTACRTWVSSRPSFDAGDLSASQSR